MHQCASNGRHESVFVSVIARAPTQEVQIVSGAKGMGVLLRQTQTFFEKNVVNINLNKFLLSGLPKFKTDLGKNMNSRN